jgi:hypothetical protein
MYLEPAKVIGTILKAKLAPLIPEGAPFNVMMSYQKFKIPTKGVLIVMSYLGGRSMTNDEFIGIGIGGMTEVQSSVNHDLIQVDMMGFGSEPRLLRSPLVMALNSLASEQAQELYGIMIGRMPSDMKDVSALESTEYLTRYTITVQTTSLFVQSSDVGNDYYDQFKTQEVFNG